MNTQQAIALPEIEKFIREFLSDDFKKELYNASLRISRVKSGMQERPYIFSPITSASAGVFFALQQFFYEHPAIDKEAYLNKNLNSNFRELYHEYEKSYNIAYAVWASKNEKYGVTLTVHEEFELWMYFLGIAHFTASYVRDKRILYIQDSLVDSISTCAFPKNAPAIALLNIPFPAFALKIKKQWYAVSVDFGLLKNDAGFPVDYDYTNTVNLNLFKLREAEGTVTLNNFCNITVSADLTLDDAFEFNPSLPQEEQQNNRNEEILTLINCLLYICGDDDIVERVGHTFHIPKKRQKKQSNDKKTITEPVLLDVGLRFAEAILHYAKSEAEQDKTEYGEGKTPMRPHIRRAHPHLYWVNDTERVTEEGKPAKKPIVRYLAPVAVRGGAENKETITIQQVK